MNPRNPTKKKRKNSQPSLPTSHPRIRKVSSVESTFGGGKVRSSDRSKHFRVSLPAIPLTFTQHIF